LPLFGGQGLGFGGAIHPVFAEIDVTIGSDGTIDFNAPVGALAASLDGDVVSVTATLADGQPLPSWLHFDNAGGKFAGIVPSDIVTGSIPSNGGVPNPPSAPTSPEKLTIEVIGRDSKGNIAIIDFTVILEPGVNGNHRTWNGPDVAPWETKHSDAKPSDPKPSETKPWGPDHRHASAAPHRDIVVPADHAATPERSLHADRVGVLTGRDGLSTQLGTHGWRGMHGERMALLDSLRHVASGGR
jgi:hypothetical protein